MYDNQLLAQVDGVLIVACTADDPRKPVEDQNEDGSETEGPEAEKPGMNPLDSRSIQFHERARTCNERHQTEQHV